MDNLLTERGLLRPRSGTKHILYICFSISARLCCKIMILYFWVNLNTRPNCVFVQNLCLPSVLQDTITNHDFGCIVVLCNLPNHYFFVKVKESHRYMISYFVTKWVKLTLCLSHLTMYWFINKFSRWILDSFNVKFLSNSTPLLCVFYPYFYSAVTILWCVWPRV